MKSLHSFYKENKENIPQSFNTFKTWVLQVEKLRKCIKVIKINTRHKYIVQDEKGILDFYLNLGA